MLASFFCGEACSVVENSPNPNPVAVYAQLYALASNEVARLQAVVQEWPKDQQAKGLEEEIEDIMATRRLALRPVMTLEEIRHIMVEAGVRQ